MVLALRYHIITVSVLVAVVVPISWYPCPKYLVESGAVWRDLGLPKRSEARRKANES